MKMTRYIKNLNAKSKLKAVFKKMQGYITGSQLEKNFLKTNIKFYKPYL